MLINKIVRDKIPEIIKSQGKKPIYHTIENDQDYIKALLDKVFEEAHELNKDTNLEEMADLLEVLYAIAQAHGYTPMQIEEARLKKLEERGAFKDRILLTSID